MIRITEQKTFRTLYSIAWGTLPFIDVFPICIYALLLLGTGLMIRKKLTFGKEGWLIGLFISAYLLQVFGYIVYPTHLNAFALEQKASFALLPILVVSMLRYDEQAGTFGIKALIAGNILAMLFCLIMAFVRFSHTHAASHFFYHQLSSAVNANAVYSSLFVAVGLLYLLEYYAKGLIRMPRWAFLSSTSFLLLSLFLLSSKMIIVVALLLAIILIARLQQKGIALALTGIIVAAFALTTYTQNPVKERFLNLNIADAKNVWTEKNFANYPFDDITIRVLLFRLGWEITNKQSWLLGNGGKAYHISLNDKMRQYHLFEGNEITGDTGYINYDMHNQYAEFFFQYGLIGLLILICKLVNSLWRSVVAGRKMTGLITSLFAFSFLSESVLETQAGIVLFTLCFVYEWISTKLIKSSQHP